MYFSRITFKSRVVLVLSQTEIGKSQRFSSAFTLQATRFRIIENQFRRFARCSSSNWWRVKRVSIDLKLKSMWLKLLKKYYWLKEFNTPYFFSEFPLSNWSSLKSEPVCSNFLVNRIYLFIVVVFSVLEFQHMRRRGIGNLSNIQRSDNDLII